MSNFVGAAPSPTHTAYSNPQQAPFEIFPNPTDDTITLRFAESRLRTIRIIDNLGKIIYGQQSSEQEVQISLKNQPAGSYRVGVDGAWKQILKQ